MLAHVGMEGRHGERLLQPRKSLIECALIEDTDSFCGDAETHVVDPEAGDCYMFPNTCVPEGWTVVGMDDPRCAGGSAAICTE